MEAGAARRSNPRIRRHARPRERRTSDAPPDADVGVWPARVPNQVLSEENYKKVMDESLPLGERLAAFASRSLWIRPLGSASYTDQINNMIAHFGKLGVVEVREGPSDRANFPATLEVEQLEPRDHVRRVLKAVRSMDIDLETPAVAPSVQEVEQDIDLSSIEKVNRFPNGLTVRR